MESPRLFPVTRTFRSGYGARSIDLSKDQNTLFVGCKDGSIIAVDLQQAKGAADTEGFRQLRRGPDTGVRYLYACQESGLDEGALLAGDDLGKLSFLRWTPDRLLENRIVSSHPGGAEREWAPVTFITDWDDQLLVSYRGQDSRLLPREILEGKEIDIRQAPVLTGVQGVCGILRAEDRGTLLICEDGALWQIGPGLKPEILRNCCEEPEQPGFISDATPVRALTGEEGLHDGLYTSTDTGVYLMRWSQDAEKPPEIKKVHLPGFSGMCIAVSYARRGTFNFLWVSDLAGDVHTFWSHVDDKEPLLYWLPFDFRLESSQAVRSIASSGTGRDEFAICQACRNEKIIVTWYGNKSSKKSPAYILAWGSLNDLKAWEPDLKSPELQWKDWCIEARLALCIEEAGAELAQFLASPRSERLAWKVLQSLKDSERARRAILLWTDALLGTLHRRLESRREQQSLGVVRWLRRLYGQIPGEDQQDWRAWMAGLPAVIEDCIRHARKWGVFGGTYSQVQEVFAPLVALSGRQVGDRPLDSIAYKTLLFSRKVDVEDEQPEDARRHLIPWDVRFLPSSLGDVPQGLIAISWGGGGIDLYRMEPRYEGIVGFIPRLTKLKIPELSKEDAPKEDTRDWGHSRSILLGTRETPEGRLGVFILRSVSRVARGGASRERERFELALINPESGEHLETLPGPLLPEGESVYTLKDLGDGLVIVGFRGSKGSARLGLLRIGAENLALLRYLGGQEEFLELPAAYPELKNINVNQIWSLDAVKIEGEYEVVVGCGDGQIWKIHLSVDGEEFKVSATLPVGRMSSPVRAVSYQPGEEDTPARVFAGAADGTILAFQRLSQERSKEESYATLWATREGGAVSRIHSFEARLGAREGKTPLVLAVTQDGMAVLFSNLEAVEESSGEPEKEKRLHRLHVPGERLGRFRVGETSFASALVPGAETADAEENAINRGRVIRLLSATGEGTLRLLTIHYPKYTILRRDEFQAIRAAWRDVLRENVEEGPIQGHLLRRAEALLSASSLVSTVMVRWILWPDSGMAATPVEWQNRQEIGAAAGVEALYRQWIPLHFQPLVDLDAAWTRLREAPESERPRLKEWLSESLTGALREARRVRDSRLFKEIIEVTLTRANHELFAQMMDLVNADEKPPEIHSDWFLVILSCLVRVRSEWLGAPEDLDNRMRIVIVRNLVDGEILWSLSKALAKAQERTKDWGDGPRTSVQQLIDSRVEQIHSFFAKGNPTLSLEVLRAVNLALARTCRRLSQEEEINRIAIEGYYQTIGDFACRAVHSTHNELGEALTHEISRTYALGLLICSSSTLRLTHRMTEADLGLDLAKRIRDQFDLLWQVQGRKMPEIRAKIFEIASGLEAQREGDYKKNLLTLGLHGRSILSGDIGQDDKELLRQWRLFERIVDWFHQLADQFVNEADDVSLDRASTFLKRCGRRPAGAGEYPYGHSRQFWQKALEDLSSRDGFPEKDRSRKGRIRRMDIHESRPHSVRPSLVLFSAELTKWCADQRKELEELKKRYRIFEPQRVLYDQALLSLERAAEGFRKGAALQKNMVLGVLGHGLLEMLDEHLLSLWEVAQTLDPARTWKREDEETPTALGPNPARAAGFADDMLNTAVKAEVIPKNLRNLQWLLSYRSTGDPLGVNAKRTAAKEREHRNFKSLLEEFRKENDWIVTIDPKARLDDTNVREIHFLRFTLNELVDNQGHNSKKPDPPKVRVKAGPRIELDFKCDPAKHDRLKDVKKMSKNLQEPVTADRDSCTRSHGMGLYLANLAAGAVGWSLEIGDLDDNKPGLLPFHLLRKG